MQPRVPHVPLFLAMEGLSLVNPKYFKKSRIKISVSPTATSNEFRLVSIYDDVKLNIDAPNGTLVLGHYYELKLERFDESIHSVFNCTFKVVATSQKSGSRAHIESVLVQYDKDMWSELIETLNLKQKQITDLLQYTRGVK